MGEMSGKCCSNNVSRLSQWNQRCYLVEGLWNVIRDVGQNRGEEKYECVILSLKVIDLNNAYLIVV